MFGNRITNLLINLFTKNQIIIEIKIQLHLIVIKNYIQNRMKHLKTKYFNLKKIFYFIYF